MRRLTILLLAVLSMWGAPAVAAPPQTINYQGYLTSNTGTPVNTTVSMVFKLWDAASGGTALWTETQPSVVVTNGVFNVVLGSVTPIPLAFDALYFLGVTVGADAEMTPRQALAASPYAFRARTVGIGSAAQAQNEVNAFLAVADISGTANAQLTAYNALPKTTQVGATLFALAGAAAHVPGATSTSVWAAVQSAAGW